MNGAQEGSAFYHMPAPAERDRSSGFAAWFEGLLLAARPCDSAMMSTANGHVGSSTEMFERSALELARLVRTRQVSSREIVDAHIARIEEVNPFLNAVVNERFAEARREADRADERAASSPDDLPVLHGVPCTIKEFFAVKGLPCTGGLVRCKDVVSTEDATTVARLRAAGAIVLGNTNIPEGGLWLETYNAIYGRTNNPWDLRRTSGGSSGGEGAIIASGGSPFGLGSDIGGSIRFPSAFCGVAGHKPSGRLVPNTGQFPTPRGEALAYLTAGPMARRVSDLMPILRLLAGPDARDPVCCAMELGDPEKVSLRDMVVIPLENNGAVRISESMRAQVRRAAKSLESRGAKIVERQFPAMKRGLEIWGAMLEAATDTKYDEVLGGDAGVSYLRELALLPFGRSRHTFPALAMGLGDRLLGMLPLSKAPLIALGYELRAELESALGDNGVLLHPPYASTAPLHHGPWATPFAGACSAIFNVLEFPSTTVPMGLDASSLPLSVQVVGARGRDHVTLAAALAVEEDSGGFILATPKQPPATGRRLQRESTRWR